MIWLMIFSFLAVYDLTFYNIDLDIFLTVFIFSLFSGVIFEHD